MALCPTLEDAKAGFNSCMVQLKLTISASVSITPSGFNSCMVQLKYYVYFLILASLDVLIPVWCNWNSESPGKDYPFCLSFNSCMVQLKLRSMFNPERGHIVLIPVWCNWNQNMKISNPCWGSFNSCMVQLKSREHRSMLFKQEF